MTRTISLSLDYIKIDDLMDLIDEPHKTVCKFILADNRKLFETARGSTYNHQTWDGGYIDHITDCMNYARHLYAFDSAFGRPMAHSLSDALLILFLHDTEKPWRITVDAEGNVSNREGLTTKEDFQKFREDKLREYGLELSPYQMNGLKYDEGEHKDYSSKHRVMNELASFCHRVDTKSAREWYDYPKPDNTDEWDGAGRFRTS